MSNSEEIHRLESELQTERTELRQDASLINEKIEETKAQLSPTNFVRHRPGVALLVGFFSGMALHVLLSHFGSRGEEVSRQSLEKIGKPVARSVFTRASQRAATRAVRGR